MGVHLHLNNLLFIVQIIYHIESEPLAGVLRHKTKGQLVEGSTFTQEDIDNARIRYDSLIPSEALFDADFRCGVILFNFFTDQREPASFSVPCPSFFRRSTNASIHEFDMSSLTPTRLFLNEIHSVSLRLHPVRQGKITIDRYQCCHRLK